MNGLAFRNADTYYLPGRPGEVDDVPEAPLRVVIRSWPLRTAPYRKPEGFAPGGVYARVERERWLVDCPFCDGCQLASRLHPVFFCVDCLHASNARATGRWFHVVWPPNPEEIEQALSGRPRIVNRNWNPGETVADLLDEQRRHETGEQKISELLDRTGVL